MVKTSLGSMSEVDLYTGGALLLIFDSFTFK